MTCRPENRLEDARQLFAMLAADEHPPIEAGRILVVVAHPDDETIGIGGQLNRMNGVRLVHVTDGAPRSPAAAGAHPILSVDDYRAQRARELENALDIAGVDSDRRIRCEIPDQEAAFHLIDVTRRLAGLIIEHGIEFVFTHTYERAHPDHDATAFAVHAAGNIVAASRHRAPMIVEMPFYHAVGGELVLQRFHDRCAADEIVSILNTEQRAIKQRMLDAHVSQEWARLNFSIETERFRTPPPRTFCRPAELSPAYYDAVDFGLTSQQWFALVERARRSLGL